MDLAQREPFDRADALAAGFTDHDIRRARIAKKITALRPGTYISTAVFDELDPPGQHLLLARAQADKCYPDEVLSHVSAAVVHGLDVWKLSLAKVHVTIDRKGGGDVGRRRILHGCQVQKSEWLQCRGFRVTSVARTVVDIARTELLEYGVCVGDSALRLGLTTSAELADALASAQFRTGVKKATRAVELMSGLSESVGESRSRLLIVSAKIATPQMNQNVYDAQGGFVGRVDFLLKGHGVIGEFDGEGKYGQYDMTAREALLAEKYRGDRLAELGWVVVRWGWNDLKVPGLVAGRLHGAIARARSMPAPVGTHRSRGSGRLRGLGHEGDLRAG